MSVVNLDDPRDVSAWNTRAAAPEPPADDAVRGLVEALEFYASGGLAWELAMDGDEETGQITEQWLEPSPALKADQGDIARAALAAFRAHPQVSQPIREGDSTSSRDHAQASSVKPRLEGETGWLIEETWSGYVHYIHRDFDARAWEAESRSLDALPYAWVASGGGVTLTRRQASITFITKNVDEALRFPTQDAAHKWIALQPGWMTHSDQFQAREHMWIDAALPVEKPFVFNWNDEHDPQNGDGLHHPDPPRDPQSEGES